MKSIFLAVIIVFSQTIIFSNFNVLGENDSSSFERINSENTKFTYYSPINVNSVEVVGEWDNWTRHNLTYSNDSYSIDLMIDEGFYCYKLIIDEIDWVLDPSHEYRKYCNGILNSGLIVENLTYPKINIVSESKDILNLKINYSAGKFGSEISNLDVYLMNNFERQNITYTWNDNDWTIGINVNFSISLFDYGKYTLYVQAFDSEGRGSNQISYPFWFEEKEFDWNGALVYMIMTDRFVNGNTSNDPASISDVSQGADWVGGDFAGVISMLESDYFQELGISALWLTPFNEGAEGSYVASDNEHRVSAYHGYWPVKSREIDSRLGTESELKELIALAHSKGIRVLNDFVINHVHEGHEYYQTNPDWFREGCVLGTADCDWTERALDGVFSNYMPDVNWQNPQVSEKFLEDAIWWQKEYDLDGSRIDAVKHVEPSAISNLVVKFEQELENSLTDYYLLGETAMGWSGDSLIDNLPQYNAINQYMGEGGLDGQGDFVLYHAVVDNVFRFGYKDFRHLDYWTLQSQENYVEGSIMTPYLGSHDTSRLISRLDSSGNNPDNKWVEQSLPQQPSSSQPYIKSRIAFSWLLTIPGAPVIYMGDEYGEYGGSDPDNRHLFRKEDQLNSNEQQLMSFIQEIGNIRAHSKDLQNGSYRPIFSDENLIVFSRETVDSETLVLINAGDTSRDISLIYGEDIFYENYSDVRNNFSFTVSDESLIFGVGSNNISIFTKSHSENSNNGDNDMTEDISDNFSNETNISDDNISEIPSDDTVDIEEDSQGPENNQDILIDDEDINESDFTDNKFDEDISKSVNNSQDDERYLIVRGILFITFLSLLITFLYTRRA